MVRRPSHTTMVGTLEGGADNEEKPGITGQCSIGEKLLKAAENTRFYSPLPLAYFLD